MKPIKIILTVVLALALSSILTGQAGGPDNCVRARQLIEEGASLKKLKQRVDLFRQAVELCPGADGPHFYYGLSLEEREDQKKQGEYSQAEEEYQRALAINPEHYGALFKLAGIEYITGRFDSARVHYERYLELDPPGADNQSTREAAVNLSTKCWWLARLPRGSVKAASLTRDPDRFAGIPTLVGDVAFQLGYSAMEVTGQLGYGLAGAGVMLGMSLLENNKNFGYSKVAKAYRRGENQKAYQFALEKLPDAVNEQGVNSEMAFHLLRIIAVCGNHAGRPLKETAPFAAGFLEMELRRRQGGAEEGGSPWLWDAVAARKAMGEYQQAEGNHYEAFIWFQSIAEEIQQYLETAEHDTRTGSEEYALAKKLQYVFQLRAAEAEAAVDSLHSRALRQIISIYQSIQEEPELEKDKNIRNWLAITLGSWGARGGLYIPAEQKKIGDLQAMMDLSAAIDRRSGEDTLSQILHRNLFFMYAEWGEYGQAFREMGRLQDGVGLVASSLSQAAAGLWTSRLYGRNFQAHSAEASLNRLPGNFHTTKYYEKINLSRQHLIKGETGEALRLLQECRAMEERDDVLRKQALSCASAMIWIMVEANASGGAAKLEQLKGDWGQAAAAGWPSFRESARFLLRSLVFSGPYEYPAKLLSDQLLSVAIAHPECTSADQDGFRQMYYLATNQLDQVAALSSIQSETASDETDTYTYLTGRGFSLGAIVAHERGKYAEAARVRRLLLGRLLPYQNLLPENVADAKVRLAESLAAMGEKKEAMRLLEEANAAFERYQSDPPTAMHQRAQTALTKLKRGEKDIGVRGKWALEFQR